MGIADCCGSGTAGSLLAAAQSDGEVVVRGRDELRVILTPFTQTKGSDEIALS